MSLEDNGLKTIEQSGAPAKTRFSDPSALRTVFDRLTQEDAPDALRRAKIQRVYDGHLPFRPDELARNGLRFASNVNWLGLKGVIDNRADGKRQVIHRWLKLKPGKTYRFEGQFRIEDGKALQPVKFGGFVQVKGKPTQWPAASLGKEPCDWRPCSFEYTLPFGGSFCLIYGIENGAGRILFRDIAVFEID